MKGFEIRKEFIEVENELYEVLRKIREDHRPVIEVWKEQLMADKVFKKEGMLFFCKHIQEAKEWIKEDTKSTDAG